MPVARSNAYSLQARLFQGFADESRLALITALWRRPQTVNELVQQTGLSQSNVSNHLGFLRSAGLVTSEQSGRFVTYHLSDERVALLLAISEALVADMAKGIYESTRAANKAAG